MRLNKFLSALTASLMISQTALGSAITPIKASEELVMEVDNNEAAEYIVRLSEAPVYNITENKNALMGYGTDMIRSREKKIERQQLKVTDYIDDGFEDVEIEFRYSQVFNGLAVIATEAQIEKIKRLPDVTDVYKCEPIPFEYEEVTASVQSTGTERIIGEDMYADSLRDDVSDDREKGEGMLIAVVDAGFQTDHSAFAVSEDTNLKIKNEAEAADFINKDLSVGNLSVSDTYKGDKIPFAYDYAALDSDVNNSKESHGTHVAGIISANNDVIKGIAPEAQLVLMKVADDGASGIRTAPIIAALDDAVKLGVDCINMSIGASFVTCSQNSPYFEAVSNIKASPVQAFFAAGNEGYGMDSSNTAYAAEVGYSSSGSPAGYEGVATIGNAFGYTNSTYGNVMTDEEGNEYIYFQEGNSNFRSDLSGKTYDFVIAGYGTEEELNELDVEGKIVIVKVGSPDGSKHTSKDKRMAIMKAGGAAMIVCVAYGTSLYDTEGFPAAIIYSSDYEALAEKGSGRLTISSTSKQYFYAQQMNKSSSYLMNERLSKTVSISAPGTLVYSSINNNSYGYMTGTSMASPSACGAYAISKAWFSENFPSYNDSVLKEKTAILSMMQNTADVIRNPDTGCLYSPRVQGAGYINLDDLKDTKVIVTNADKTDGVAYVGDTEGNSISFEMNIQNISDESVTYDKITAVGLIDNVEDGCIVGTREISLDFTLPQSITVAANSSNSFNISAALSNEQRTALDETFENGFFLDGYIFLNNQDGTLEEISYPFTSFIGDWSSAPIFDTGYYEGENLYDGTALIYYNQRTGYYITAGSNLADGSPDKSRIALSTKGSMASDGFVPALQLFFLRPADGIYIYLDGVKRAGIEDSIEGYYSAALVISSLLKGLSEGMHTISLEGIIGDDISQTITTSFCIDNTSPVINDLRLTENNLTLIISENYNLNSALLEVDEEKYIGDIAKREDGDYLVSFYDIPKSENDEYIISVYDDAYNCAELKYRPNHKLTVTEKVFENVDNKYTAGYYIENTDWENHYVSPVLALYDEMGRLYDLEECGSATMISGHTGYAEFIFETDKAFSSGYVRKLFLFETLSSMMPIAPELTIEGE